MKKIILQLRQHIRETFSFKLVVGLLFFMAFALFVNYSLDFEDNYLDRLPFVQRWPAMFLFHVLPYLAICLLIEKNRLLKSCFSEKGFWFRLLAGFGILSFDRSLSLQYLFDGMTNFDSYYLTRIAGRLASLFTVVLPLVILSATADKRLTTRMYGLPFGNFNVRPYLVLLFLAGALILAGGYFKDIQEHYPRYIEVGGPAFAMRHSIPFFVNVLVYEAAYGIDFVSVELFFRGFLVFAFSRYLGPYVVYPMMATYCFLHFGKPLTEALSSLAGGYILGVIAIHSRSIWGGVILHVGLAWLMEIIGYWYRT